MAQKSGARTQRDARAEGGAVIRRSTIHGIEVTVGVALVVAIAWIVLAVATSGGVAQ
jgi:hypothetical protein